MQSAKIFVTEDQQSLAIGKGGQNARLAAKLTGWKIDISSIGGDENEDGENENPENIAEITPESKELAEVKSDADVADEELRDKDENEDEK